LKYYKIIDTIFDCVGVYKGDEKEAPDGGFVYEYVGGVNMGDTETSRFMNQRLGYTITEISKEEAFLEIL